jgi:mannose-1-phosphate guanylyltransferase/phosphomannomutase
MRFVGGRGIVFTDFFFRQMRLFVAKILEMLATTGKSLGAIDRELPRLYRTRRTVNCSWEHKGKVMRNIMQATEEFRRDLVDGIRLYLPGDAGASSVILIPDKERPLFHVGAEAQNLQHAETLAAEYEQRIIQWRDEA